MPKLSTTFYLHLVPNGVNYSGRVTAVKAERITQKAPRYSERFSLPAAVVAVTVSVPSQVFDPLATVAIDVPEDALTVIPEVQVTTTAEETV